MIPQLAAAFNKQFGRDSGGLIRPYRTEDAETIVVALGSVNGTVQEVVDEMRERGSRIGSVSILLPPVPASALREALQHAKRVVVLEKCLAVGLGGIVSDGCASRCRASCSTATPSSRALAGARSPAFADAAV